VVSENSNTSLTVAVATPDSLYGSVGATQQYQAALTLLPIRLVAEEGKEHNADTNSAARNLSKLMTISFSNCVGQRMADAGTPNE